MRDYKPLLETSKPMNTSAPIRLIDEFLIAATDLDLGEDFSKAIQTVMEFVIKNKNNEKFKKEVKKLKNPSK